MTFVSDATSLGMGKIDAIDTTATSANINLQRKNNNNIRAANGGVSSFRALYKSLRWD
jgi:hypothetical protein